MLKTAVSDPQSVIPTTQNEASSHDAIEPLFNRLLACLSARLILKVEGWAFLETLARQVIHPWPTDLSQLGVTANSAHQTLRQEIQQRRVNNYPKPTDATAFEAEQLFLRLIRNFHLDALETDLLLLALAPELDERFGDLFAHINGTPQERRLPVHKACLLLLDQQTERSQIQHTLLHSALWQAGILSAAIGCPLFERTLKVGRSLQGGVDKTAILLMSQTVWHGVADTNAQSSLLEARPSLMQKTQALMNWSEHQQQPVVLVFKENDATEGNTYLTALSATWQHARISLSVLQKATITNQQDLLLAAVMLTAIPIIRLDTALELQQVAQQLPLFWDTIRLPLIILSAKSLPSTLPGISIRQLDILPPDPLEQADFWQQSLVGYKHTLDVDLLANRNRISQAEMQHSIRLAESLAISEQSPAINHQHMLEAMREILREPVSPYTNTEWPNIPWESLVLHRQPLAQLESLVSRVHQRVTVENRWQMTQARQGGATALAALLYGESGTGKTFAVKAVASRLQLPLIRVDLSQVVSKYLGQTEEQLNAVFDMAEGYRGLLFFDEADSLFGKRTGIKDSHDRHANLQVNFLLQRLEQFEGVTILASNYQQNMDQAFTRRISFSINFPRPGAIEQLAIWHSQLPGQLREQPFNLKKFVGTYDLTGGEIRNCALRAAYAAAANQSNVTETLLEDAILQEFIKMGRPQPGRRVAQT